VHFAVRSTQQRERKAETVEVKGESMRIIVIKDRRGSHENTRVDIPGTENCMHSKERVRRHYAMEKRCLWRMISQRNADDLQFGDKGDGFRIPGKVTV